MRHEAYMRRAIHLADQGRGWVNPNPCVGAVIVKAGEIIAEGYHQKFGGPHAEIVALNNSKASPKGATLYVTLEPCCHHGKTPPCTDAIINAGIRRVFIGTSDPNPLVAGNGSKTLKNAGLNVFEGLLEAECKKLSETFFHFIKTNTPYVTMKYAMTLDGKIATVSGLSKWITGPQARTKVHEDRHRNSAIMVGVNTILSDNPNLTCRIEDRKNPIRIICDSNLKTPLNSNAITLAETDSKTIIATCVTDGSKISAYTDKGIKIITTPRQEGRVDLKELMRRLGKEGIDSIILEGGAKLNWSMLSQGLVKKVQAYIAPKLFGGAVAPSPIAGTGVLNPSSAFNLTQASVTILGDDILIESEVISCSQE